MKLICKVDVCNRLVPTLPIKDSKKKFQRSSLAIGKQSPKEEEICLLLQSQTNKSGVKYKIFNNVEQVFTKFLNEGKTTIRFKDPPHDLSINGDPIQVKSFLHILKLALTNKLNSAASSIITLSDLKTKKLPPPLKTKIIIKKISEYPILQGFPRTTEELHIAGLERKSFDRQILKLQSLRVLNLSNNNITSLPQELGNLQNLQELNVSQNQLGKSPLSKWSWLNGSVIRQKLRLLNLSSNQLTFVPRQIKNLYSLVHLNLSDNSLVQLPQGIGNLIYLKFLYVAKNQLKYLPGNLKNLRLSIIDLSGNPFNYELNVSNEFSCNIKVPTLVECASRIILKTRKHYDAKTVPYTLVNYLDNAHYCMCGTACFESYIKKLMPINISNIAEGIISSYRSDIQFICYLCSVKCARKYDKNHC